MMNFNICVLSICLLMTLVLHQEVDAGSCPKLEGKILDNLLDMMVAIKSGSSTPPKLGGSSEKDRPAFTATLKSHLSLSNGVAVKFDTVLLNRGQGYSPKTGIFTATKTGLYQISATVMSNNGDSLHCCISKNGKNLMNIYGPKIHGGTETANPVLELEKGDQVSVKGVSSTKIYGEHFSYFSAVYISQ
ncbi:collagen alpha-1(X) chain-like [Mytilus trossulus]|uniref:collagen alpha-1(X) chain-like n=1 Tax=Mytilus trossulus TaxID=6551 RepID=UPI0030075F81